MFYIHCVSMCCPWYIYQLNVFHVRNNPVHCVINIMLSVHPHWQHTVDYFLRNLAETISTFTSVSNLTSNSWLYHINGVKSYFFTKFHHDILLQAIFVTRATPKYLKIRLWVYIEGQKTPKWCILSIIIRKLTKMNKNFVQKNCSNLSRPPGVPNID